MVSWTRGQVVKLERREKIEKIFRRQIWVEFGEGGNMVGEKRLRRDPRFPAEKSHWMNVLISEMGNYWNGISWMTRCKELRA